MCKWGDTVPVNIYKPAHLTATDEAGWKIIGIDRCIASIVKALQQHGINMISSCCGHGRGDGEIILTDGRTLVIKEASDANMR